MCPIYKNNLKKYHLQSYEDSDYNDLDVPQCTYLRKKNLSSFAEQLHKKLSKTLDANSNFFQKCIDCGDVVG